MSDDGYRIRDQYAIHFVTFAVVQWVDVFTRSEYADIVVDSLNFCKKEKSLRIHAWCIMSNHLHLIISATEGGPPLSDILRDFKKFTSVKIIKSIEGNSKESRRGWMLWIFKSAGENNKRNLKYQFWQQDNHPEECSDFKMLETKIIYLHENPVRAGMTRTESEYVYSSAIDYYNNGKGLIDIDFIN
jgi:putative transposase